MLGDAASLLGDVGGGIVPVDRVGADHVVVLVLHPDGDHAGTHGPAVLGQVPAVPRGQIHVHLAVQKPGKVGTVRTQETQRLRDGGVAVKVAQHERLDRPPGLGVVGGNEAGRDARVVKVPGGMGQVGVALGRDEVVQTVEKATAQSGGHGLPVDGDEDLGEVGEGGKRVKVMSPVF